MDELEFTSNSDDYFISSVFKENYEDFITFQMIDNNGELKHCTFTYGTIQENEIDKSFTLLVTEGLCDTAEFNVYSDPYKQISFINALFTENSIIKEEEELEGNKLVSLYNPIINNIKKQKVRA